MSGLSPTTIQRGATRRVNVQGANLREITNVTSVPPLTIKIPGSGSATSVPLDFVLDATVAARNYALTIEFGPITKNATITVTA